MVSMLTMSRWYRRTRGPGSVILQDVNPIGQPRVTFLGHATVMIEMDGVRVLTDPVLRARIGPLTRLSGSPDPEAFARPDVVLISHSHWDHLDYGSLKLLGLSHISGHCQCSPAARLHLGNHRIQV